MVGGADHCKYRSVAADAVCVSKCLVAAAAGILLCHRAFAERHRPRFGDDLRADCLDRSLCAARAGLLLIAAALCGVDLSSGSFARQPPKSKSGSRFLKE